MVLGLHTVIPSSILSFIEIHGYTVLFLLIMLDGLFVTYVAGFAASLGYFNIYLLFIVAPLANTATGSLLYFLGRYGRKTFLYERLMRKIGEDRVRRIESHLRTHFGKTIAMIKLTPPLPVPGNILSGASKVPFKKFLFYSFIIDAAISSLLIILGFYSGVAFSSVSKYFKYVEISIGAAVILIILIWFAFRKVEQKITGKLEKI